MTLYCRNCASEMSARSPRQSRASARRLLDRLERHGDAAHGIVLKSMLVDRQQRVCRQAGRDRGIRNTGSACGRPSGPAPAPRPCAVRRPPSAGARRPPIGGRPGNWMVTLLMPPPASPPAAKAGIVRGTRPPSAKRPMPSSTLAGCRPSAAAPRGTPARPAAAPPAPA